MKKSLLFVLTVLLVGFAASAQTDTIVSKVPSNKNVILELFTATGSGYCPEGHVIVNEIVAHNPDRVFPIYLHRNIGNNPYLVSNNDHYANQAGSTGCPQATINRHVFGNNTKTVVDMNMFSHYSSQILSAPSPVNIAAKGTLDYNTRELNLTVQLYYTSSSDASYNRLNVAVLQKNVIGRQRCSEKNPAQVVGDRKYNHRYMFRQMITGLWGPKIDNVTAGSFVEKTFTYVIPEEYGYSGGSVAAVLQDLDFVVFVAEDRQEILNGTKADITLLNVPTLKAEVVNVSDLLDQSCDNKTTASFAVKNLGLQPIDSVAVQYTVSGDTAIYTSSAMIPFDSIAEFIIPEIEVATNIPQTLSVSLISINGQPCEDSRDSVVIQKHTYTCGGWMMLEIKTDSNSHDNSYMIIDPAGNVLEDRSFPNNMSMIHRYAFRPDTVGCYQIVVRDLRNDGMNSGHGEGYIKLYDADHNLVFDHNGVFEKYVMFNLDVTYPTSVESHILSEGGVRIYPNPASTVLNFESDDSILGIQMFNMQGQMVKSESGDIRSMSIRDLPQGIYMAKIRTASKVTVQKIVKQ